MFKASILFIIVFFLTLSAYNAGFNKGADLLDNVKALSMSH